VGTNEAETGESTRPTDRGQTTPGRSMVRTRTFHGDELEWLRMSLNPEPLKAMAVVTG
jgi:hypothetical protein